MFELMKNANHCCFNVKVKINLYGQKLSNEMKSEFNTYVEI